MADTAICVIWIGIVHQHTLQHSLAPAPLVITPSPQFESHCSIGISVLNVRINAKLKWQSTEALLDETIFIHISSAFHTVKNNQLEIQIPHGNFDFTEKCPWST